MVDALHDSHPQANSHPPPPLVSVIVPAFNSSAHIAAALDSILAQSFRDYEIILVNDGSTDTVRLDQALQPYLARIKYLSQENLGPSAARNAGIRSARGEWLAFLDSDDTWLPNYLEQQINFLSRDRTLDFVYCNASLAGETKATGKTFMDVCPSEGLVTFESVLVEQTQVLTSGTVIRRGTVETAGLFDENLRCSEDHDLWLRVLHFGGKALYQRQVLLRRNVRLDGQGSAPGSLLRGEIASLQKLDRELDLTPATRDQLRQRLRQIEGACALIDGKSQLRAGNAEEAYQSLSRAYAAAPNAKLHVLLLCLKIFPALAVTGARLWTVRSPNLRRA